MQNMQQQYLRGIEKHLLGREYTIEHEKKGNGGSDKDKQEVLPNKDKDVPGEHYEINQVIDVVFLQQDTAHALNDLAITSDANADVSLREYFAIICVVCGYSNYMLQLQQSRDQRVLCQGGTVRNDFYMLHHLLELIYISYCLQLLTVDVLIGYQPTCLAIELLTLYNTMYLIY